MKILIFSLLALNLVACGSQSNNKEAHRPGPPPVRIETQAECSALIHELTSFNELDSAAYQLQFGAYPNEVVFYSVDEIYSVSDSCRSDIIAVSQAL